MGHFLYTYITNNMDLFLELKKIINTSETDEFNNNLDSLLIKYRKYKSVHTFKELDRLSMIYSEAYDFLTKEINNSLNDLNLICEDLDNMTSWLFTLGDAVACAQELRDVKISKSDRDMWKNNQLYYKQSVKSSTNHQTNLKGINDNEIFVKLYNQLNNIYKSLSTKISQTQSKLSTQKELYFRGLNNFNVKNENN